MMGSGNTGQCLKNWISHGGVKPGATVPGRDGIQGEMEGSISAIEVSNSESGAVDRLILKI